MCAACVKCHILLVSPAPPDVALASSEARSREVARILS